MPEWVPYVIGIVVVVGIVVAIGMSMERKRTQALTAFANENGFLFQGENWGEQQRKPMLQSALFDKGRKRKFNNIMTGSASRLQVSLFDYSYMVGYGRYARYYNQTIAAYSDFSSSFGLPLFEMRPRGFGQKIGEMFSRKHITFDSHPDFSRRFQVRTPEPEKTRQMFTPALLSYLENIDAKKKWKIEGVGDTLVIYRHNKRTKPAELRVFLEGTSTLASQFFNMP